MDDKIVVYIDDDLREVLELHIINNDLDREKITLAKFANQIVKEWHKNPKLDEEYIFFAYRKGYSGRVRRLTIFLEEEEYINLNRLYVRKYIRKIKSENMMIANALEQWAIKNIPAYKEIFLKKFSSEEVVN